MAAGIGPETDTVLWSFVLALVGIGLMAVTVIVLIVRGKHGKVEQQGTQEHPEE